MSKTVLKFDDFEWIDLQNPTESEFDSVEFPFDIDANFLEDVFEIGHLPKIERTPEYTFIILRAYTATDSEKIIKVEQLSSKVAFFINKKSLVTIHKASFSFMEKVSPDFKSTDEVALRLFSELLMTYEQSILNQTDRMDEFEQNIFLEGGGDLSIEKLYYEKSKARLVKKILLISQDVLSQLSVSDELASTLQDLKDTLLHLTLNAEEVVEDANSLLNSHMTFTAQKNNDVMKLLTVFSAFFLPLTFIVGVYGMNFREMPELSFKYGYYVTWLVMLIISVLIYIWFKRKKIL
ncbi:CorA family divalent cation transporter [Porphyromonadaceae bacterium W3.11]|nr:CorA family divalent cation transporter [Porphyromonadaceae bacterium W3.11]